MSTNQMETYLTELEDIGEQVVNDRRSIVEFDRRRHQVRESLRNLKNIKDKNCWIEIGTTFFKLETTKVTTMLQNDSKNVEVRIDELHDGLKKKVDKMRQLENKPELCGFGLKPLNNDELKAIYQTVGK